MQSILYPESIVYCHHKHGITGIHFEEETGYSLLENDQSYSFHCFGLTVKMFYGLSTACFPFWQDTAELFFEDVRLPKFAILGEANKGFYYLMQELPQERLIIADVAQAASEWMFEETRDYVKQRKAFGKTLSHLQVNFNWGRGLSHV